jgi:hypothetical protein
MRSVEDDLSSGMDADLMLRPNAFAMLRRGSPADRDRRPALSSEDAASIRCRHCGGARLKLSYRRREESVRADSVETGTTFILRCDDCQGFTTVSA